MKEKIRKYLYFNMKEPVYFKCKLIGIQCPKDRFWCDFLREIQKKWPTDNPIVLNKGTDNECEALYICWSRIDAYPIFKLVKGEIENIESGVSWCIDNNEFKSKDIIFINTILNVYENISGNSRK